MLILGLERSFEIIQFSLSTCWVWSVSPERWSPFEFSLRLWGLLVAIARVKVRSTDSQASAFFYVGTLFLYSLPFLLGQGCEAIVQCVCMGVVGWCERKNVFKHSKWELEEGALLPCLSFLLTLDANCWCYKAWVIESQGAKHKLPRHLLYIQFL